MSLSRNSQNSNNLSFLSQHKHISFFNYVFSSEEKAKKVSQLTDESPKENKGEVSQHKYPSFYPFFSGLHLMTSALLVNQVGSTATGKHALDFWSDPSHRKTALSLIRNATLLGLSIDTLLFAGHTLKQKADENNYDLKLTKSGFKMGGTLGLIPATMMYCRLNNLRSIFWHGIPHPGLTGLAVFAGCAAVGSIAGGIADTVTMSKPKTIL